MGFEKTTSDKSAKNKTVHAAVKTVDDLLIALPFKRVLLILVCLLKPQRNAKQNAKIHDTCYILGFLVVFRII